MLHIEDERRVAEESPRCKPRVPQIASPRRGSVVTAATRSRACLFTCSLSNLAIHLYSQIYCPPFPPFSASYFVDKRLFVLCISSISMQVKSYQFSSLTEDDEDENGECSFSFTSITRIIRVSRHDNDCPFIYVYLPLEVTISVKTKDIFFFPSLRFDSIGFEAIGETG